MTHCRTVLRITSDLEKGVTEILKISGYTVVLATHEVEAGGLPELGVQGEPWQYTDTLSHNKE